MAEARSCDFVSAAVSPLPVLLADLPKESMPLFADFRAEAVVLSCASAAASLFFSSLVSAEVLPVLAADSLYCFVSSRTLFAALLYSLESAVTVFLVSLWTLLMPRSYADVSSPRVAINSKSFRAYHLRSARPEYGP